MKIKDKIVMVTGGARGIGRAIVEKFAQQGAKISYCDLNQEDGKALLDQLGEGHEFQKIDVADRGQVQQWADSVASKYERIDVLINNAGIVRDNFLVKVKEGELVKQMPEQDFDMVIDVNLKGVFNCAQAVTPYMIKQKSGVILNASSVVAPYGNIGQTNYVASKCGVLGMTRVWARELGRYNIRVNAVLPGFVATEMVKQMPQKIIDTVREKTPLGRLAEPDELACAYLWLTSDDASFITGAEIAVDGGLVLGT